MINKRNKTTAFGLLQSDGSRLQGQTNLWQFPYLDNHRSNKRYLEELIWARDFGEHIVWLVSVNG